MSLQIISKYLEQVDEEKYFNQLNNHFSEATKILNKITKPKENNYSIIFDIDETALSNLHFHKKGLLHRHSTMDEVVKIHILSQATPIQPCVDFYNYAMEKGFYIFFLTGRPCKKQVVEATILNLENAGFYNWHNIYFAPEDTEFQLSKFHKIDTRKKIINNGYHIFLNIGDQEGDLIGGLSEFTIKLPNPLYMLD